MVSFLALAVDAPGQTAKAQPGKKGANPATRAQTRRATDPKPSPKGPHPKWVCEKPIVELGELWAGGTLKPKWVVRNEGEAALQLKIRGG
jgi:hypothetical protein